MTRRDWEAFKASRNRAKGFEEALGVAAYGLFLAQLIFFTFTGGF